MTVLGLTNKMDGMIAKREVNGDLIAGELDDMAAKYKIQSDADRARIRGFVDRRLKESLEEGNLSRARACTQIRDSIISVMTGGA